jgi:2-polyprenyl-6-hydroxyphenyl methylase/3-demethylubiquinone-9 3-methyltransferase
MLRKDVRKAGPGTAAPDEIARFNALADEWWKPGGAFKVIHAFNAVRVAHLAERLPALLPGATTAAQPLLGTRLLDVGCAAGLVTEPLSRLGAETIGIDAAERNIMVARQHAAKTGATVGYRHALPEDLAGEAERFDIVLSLEVVEHVADLQHFLETVARLVRPGGLLVIGTINRTLRSFVKAILGAEHLLRWLPRGTHDWRKFVTPKELSDALAPHGLQTIERAGIVLNPLIMRWHLSEDCSVTYLQVFRKS